MVPEIIRMGDPTSHDGKVIEGSHSDICLGKPIAYIGHKVYCPKCKGTFPIIEGVPSTTFYGKGVALAGMKTSCGAILIATQFTDTVDWASNDSRNDKRRQSRHNDSIASEEALATEQSHTGSTITSQSSGSSLSIKSFDEQAHLAASAIAGLPYVIETRDGRQFSGRTPTDGKLPRIDTAEEDEYVVFWGDEALARLEGMGE